MTIDDNTISVEVAAKLVGRSERRIRQLCQQAKIGCRKIGREWLIDRVTLLEYFARQEADLKRKAKVQQVIRETEIK